MKMGVASLREYSLSQGAKASPALHPSSVMRRLDPRIPLRDALRFGKQYSRNTSGHDTP
jgi:hypothetical protein